MKRTNKWFHIGLTSALAAGTLFAGVPFATISSSAAAATISGGGADLGKHFNQVNHDRIIKSLVDRGVIPAGLNPEQQEDELNKYLNQRVKAAELQNKSNKKTRSDALRGAAASGAAAAPLAPASPVAWDGSVLKDKILVLLVEYSDFAHNTLTANDTDFYYKNYDAAHYREMLFNPNGYIGPDGERKYSMSQYYLEQSGGSYTVEGDVVGWLKAPKTAAYYGGNVNGDDANPRELVRTALAAAAASGVDLGKYDEQDIYDLDGDGNYREADGLVDHLMIVHAGSGEEAGGATLGEDAIWSHRWDLSSPYAIPGTKASVPYWGGQMAAFDYTIEPEDGAPGVFAHEFGHDLGLPDEYDTNYTGDGEPVEYYSIMSAGSWAGKIGGTEPTGFSPYAKEYFQQTYGGNWQHGKSVDLSALTSQGVTVTLDQASTHGKNEDVVRINLPDKVRAMNTPATGSYEFYGGRGDEVFNTMTASVDLTGAASATLDYDTYFNIEETWDYGFVQVSVDNGTSWQSLSTPNTRSDVANGGYPDVQANVPGYTGSSNGWIHESIDLSAYAGKKIDLRFVYATDWSTNTDGFFVDNVKVTANNAALLEDGAEGTSSFAFDGFEKSDGTFKTSHHYLVEWRNAAGTDTGLVTTRRGQSVLKNDTGMLVWYVNDAYDNNWVGEHPGYGFVGVVDAHSNVHHWGGYEAGGATAGTRYQIYDAAFSLKKGHDLSIYYDKGFHLSNAAKAPIALFDDKVNYWSPSTPSSGLKLPTYGLKIQVVSEAADRSAATIKIFK